LHAAGAGWENGQSLKEWAPSGQKTIMSEIAL
jgi:hypothetical protein